MSNPIKYQPRTVIMSLAIGVLIGFIGFTLLNNLATVDSTDVAGNKKSAAEPLYWVAPMDDNYRRDKPGKSPMGMDLVPVYAKTDSSDLSSPGTIQISPHIINNLGVRTAAVEFKPLQKPIYTLGTIQYDENNVVHIHPRVEGWINTLYVKATGDPVTKGQALYTLYSPQLVNAQEEYLIALKRNNQALVTAAKARLQALQLSNKFIQTLSQTKQVKQSITFYAPQSGVVDGLKIREGFYVKPGTTIMSIGQLDTIWVEIDIVERDAARIKTGQAVSITLDYLPTRQWQGVINYIYPSLDPKTRTLRARIELNNTDLTLKPNMFAQVVITTHAKQPAILVPKSAVIRTGKQNRVVQALGAGHFKSVAVSLGQTNNEFIEITAGLAQYDNIVTSAHFLIDSESSKNSDFIRMSNKPSATAMIKSTSSNELMPEANQTRPSATVNGVINQINISSRTLNISRDAIKKWGREATTMDFKLAETLDISQLQAAMNVTFTFEVADDFIITAIKPVHVMSADMHTNH
ncbi:efflux RND transporter periplasmic adaptor subunit [Algibacillus agarilyticus]|uniref:efflux RND transporter periplasmic adaptor subunit n=1 Tax=Algibacillus agarilyticus TaxID=2234133 RepID=UPI001E28BCA4|nr:efflux RND transporter periplasmic adaptor subunit [Algibacillus agarilyticus]